MITILFLGVIIGLLLAVIALIITLWSKPKLERIVNQTQSILKEKGAIIDPDNEEVEDFINSIKQQ